MGTSGRLDRPFPAGPSGVEIWPVTTDRLADLAALFETHPSTRGCWCQAFSVTRKVYHAGWSDGGNRARLEKLAETADPPVGLLAYREGEPVAWCSLGPRSRYPAAIGPRSRILKNRDASEDAEVWLLPCFFVRVGCRRAGITYDLLRAAVELARGYGAPAIEGWPRAGDDRRQSDLYLGREKLFAECGFRCVDRPSPHRAVMRLDLTRS